MEMYPFKFKPIFKPRLWGGRRLAEVFGKDLPPGEKVGESWELADLPDDKTVIANGRYQGQTLAQVLAQEAPAVFGPIPVSAPFPLLIKLLDSQEALSVQVHPNEKTCARTGKGQPKTECWYVMDAAPDAFIYKGLQPGVTRDEFSAALAQEGAERLLCKVPVTPGECHFIPAGTVHAIGPGLLIAEIQQPSDTTYRLYDYNRRDAQGELRALHIADGLASVQFGQTPEDLPVTTVGRLVDCDFFKVDKKHHVPGGQALLGRGELTVQVFLDGSGSLTGGFDETGVRAGDCVMIPASCDAVFQCEQECTFLTVTL